MKPRLYSALTVLSLVACEKTAIQPQLPPPAGPLSVRVHGNQLMDQAGRAVRLRGVDRSGTEYACAQGWGIFDGPSAYSGNNYQKAISDFVTLFNRAGLVVILDLHWSAAGTAIALGQAPMPDRDHTPDFWREVAAAYKGNDGVVFDLFNEPFPDNNADTPEAWRCWRDGGTCSGMSFQAAGMQELVDAVRTTGATNVIMVGGVQYAATLSNWLANKPTDPLNNIAASWHIYNFSWCNTQACWDSNAAPVAQQVPLVLGELGQDDYGSAFVTSLMDWMDARQGSYLAWSWDVWGQSLDLIQSYDGTPTPYGRTFQVRFGS